MKIVTWNLNSIRARQDRLLRWLERETPDIVCLQELRSTEDRFPADELRALGYSSAVHAEKGRNGVAIISRDPARKIARGMGAAESAHEARLVSAEIAGTRVLCAYAPSGTSVASSDFDHKLCWLERLREHLVRTASPDDELILAGDLNVAPDDWDVANPTLWGRSVLCHPAVRDALERIREWGLIDVVRQRHPGGGLYTWWDYQRRAFERGDGLRIDHILVTDRLADRCTAAWVDRDERRAGPTPPSDHAPVVAEFEF